MSAGIMGIFASKPKGSLTYCSYSKAGAAGLGKDYCELIADPDSVPRIVVVLDEGNRFGDPVTLQTYPVDASTVDTLQQLLLANKVYKLNGYNVDEAICGGYSYRIYMEYSSGDRVNARWYGHKVSDEAWSAYALIERFFSPWRPRAVKDGKIQLIVERVTKMEAAYKRVSSAIRKKKAYPELQDDVYALQDYLSSKQWKEDFEAAERGELPKELHRGVLSEDGLYNLLGNRTLERLLGQGQ